MRIYYLLPLRGNLHLRVKWMYWCDLLEEYDHLKTLIGTGGVMAFYMNLAKIISCFDDYMFTLVHEGVVEILSSETCSYMDMHQ